MTFNGWPAEAIEFYEGLTADNSRSYWQAHKADYEEFVRRPMIELLAELEPEFGEGKIFRPYRDLRFSKDKTPYKTSIAATLAHGGYVALSADGLSAGSGSYHLEPDQLDRFRRAVADDSSGAKLADIVATVRRAGLQIAAHDVLKTCPKGYPKDHPRVELLRYKGLITWTQWPAGAWLGTSEAKERVAGFLRASTPLNDWLAAHVGDSELAAGR
ncbi:MAG: DUF2461 domain-containing protein [Micromonosporaceae bacterium]